MDAGVIAETLAELASDFTIGAVHIGMLGNEAVALAVADFLAQTKLPHVVLDPILRSTSGADLIDWAGTKVMIERLIPLCELVTPNLEEAGVLCRANSDTSGAQPVEVDALSSRRVEAASSAESIEAMRTAARGMHSLGAANVVITGGHLEKAIDLLSFTTSRGIEQELFKAERQKSTSTHGTGCAFSTALACHLAHGRGLPEAALLSKAYVSAAIANAQPLGHGAGPLNHLYRMHERRRPGNVVSEAEPAHAHARR